MLDQSPETSDLELQQLVEKHEIRWQTAREEAVVDGEIRTIGLRLELSALHSHPEHPPVAGCSECKPVVHALERVIDAVLPKEHRRSHYEVSVPPAMLNYTTSGRPEITATITILHNEGINDPVDPCETQCHAEMTAKLKALGAREGHR
jgi:hypothetical protein